jgi:hypothetical protein
MVWVRRFRRKAERDTHELRLDGRSPDYKASLINTLGAKHEFYGTFADNANA